MPTVTNLTGYRWEANNSLASFPSQATNYTINFTSNNTNFDKFVLGTNTLSYLISQSMTLYAVYANSAWDANYQWGKTILITGGTDVTNASLIAYLQANGTLTPTMITLDLSTIGLPYGVHTIQVAAADDVWEDSELSAGITFTYGYSITVTLNNASASASNPELMLPDTTATLFFNFDGTSYKCPTDAPTVTGATGVWTKVSDTEGRMQLSNPTGPISFTVEGYKEPWDETTLTGTTWRLKNQQYTSLSSPSNYNITWKVSYTWTISTEEGVKSVASDTFVWQYSSSPPRFTAPSSNVNSVRILPWASTPLNSGFAYYHGGIGDRPYVVTSLPTIEFGSGSGATDQKLIDWFKTNADLISW